LPFLFVKRIKIAVFALRLLIFVKDILIRYTKN